MERVLEIVDPGGRVDPCEPGRSRRVRWRCGARRRFGYVPSDPVLDGFDLVVPAGAIKLLDRGSISHLNRPMLSTSLQEPGGSC